jgi:hypothetical protein
VEEGTPIYGPGSEGVPKAVRYECDRDHDHDNMEEDKEDHPSQPAKSAPALRVSSLQLAAKSSGRSSGSQLHVQVQVQVPAKRRSKTNQSSYVIGGPSVQTSAGTSPAHQAPTYQQHYQSSTYTIHSTNTAAPQQQQQQQHHHQQHHAMEQQHHIMEPHHHDMEQHHHQHAMEMEEEHPRHAPLHSYQHQHQVTSAPQHTAPPIIHQPHQYSVQVPSHHAPSSTAHHHYQNQTQTHSAFRKSPVIQTSYEIGAETTCSVPSSSALASASDAGAAAPMDKMVGVQDHGVKAPLVVLDGANVAHAYAVALDGLHFKGGSSDPDATGIQVATDYFQSTGVRVLVVLPQYWFRSKSSSKFSSSSSSNHHHQQQQQQVWNHKVISQWDILNALQTKGLIVASPPADDDDAYALTIARREESRSLRRQGEGPGFVLSNDMFRDAQRRDATGTLQEWLTKGRHESIGPGRISYAFCDMGTMNDHGERILDFVPNPRHPVVIWVEGMQDRGESL